MPKRNPELKGIVWRRGKAYFRPPMVDGFQPKEIPLNTSDQAEAIVRRRALVLSGEAPQAGLFRHDVEKYLREAEADEKFSAASLDSKGAVLRRIARDLPATISTRTPPTVLQAWLDERRRGDKENKPLSPQSLLTYRTLLHGFYEWAGVVPNPTANLKLPRVVELAAEGFCSKALRDRLLEACDREDLRLVMMLGFFAGMRSQEILHCRWDWIDFDRRLLMVQADAEDGWQPKWGRGRVITMSARLTEFLEAYGERQPYLLRPEKPAEPEKLLRWDWDSALDGFMRKHEGFTDCGGVRRRVTVKVMRHTFGSLLACAGDDLYRIKEQMGHRSIKTTERHYARLQPNLGRADLLD